MSEDAVTVKFIGCEYLDYEDHYNTARKQLLTGDRVFWMREAPYKGASRMVQFCKRRGRINEPEGCLSEERAHCSNFCEVQHTVIVPDP